SKLAHEVLDLVYGDRVAHADIDPAPLVKGASPVDADEFARHVKERSAAVAGIDGCIYLDAVRVLEQGARWVLITMNAADQPVSYGRLKIGGQEERITDDQGPVTLLHLVTVTERGRREYLAGRLRQQFDEGYIAYPIQSNENGIVELAIG